MWKKYHNKVHVYLDTGEDMVFDSLELAGLYFNVSRAMVGKWVNNDVTPAQKHHISYIHYE